jgi:hypothetical protein
MSLVTESHATVVAAARNQLSAAIATGDGGGDETAVQYKTPVDGSEILIAPGDNRKVAVVMRDIDNNSNNVEFDLDVVTTGSKVGDELIVMLSYSDPSGKDVDCNLSDNFYYTQCGSPTSTIDDESLERNVQRFIFDGVQFVGTADNC